MIVGPRGWVLAGLLALAGAPASAATSSSVTFPSLDASLSIPAKLIVPDGAGPFPAVVIVHDCSGVGARASGAPARWADELVPQGYAVLIPDSFTPRGFPGGVCTEPPTKSSKASGFVRAADAYGALAYLRTVPTIDGTRVGIMGGSHGGWTTLASMNTPDGPNPRLVDAKRNGFAAGVALYPFCDLTYGAWQVTRAKDGQAPPAYSGAYKPIAPTLILIGELDDWTPAEPCRRLVDASQAAGYPMEITVYPGVHHAFDNNSPSRYEANRTNRNSPTGKGATTGGNPAAWADAKVRVSDFFARHLGDPR